MINLIYCAGGNPKFSQIAHEEGFLMGVRSDASHAFGYKIEFVDIDYKKPDFEKHLARVAKEKPRYATVPDLSDKVLSLPDIERVIEQTGRLQNYCETVFVVPKLPGQLALLPANIAIGYSIPTSYGGAQYPIWELTGRKVHLLGGSPQKQLEAFRYISAFGQVVSADGNMAQKLALQYLKYWQKGKWLEWPNKDRSEHYNAWRVSCQNIYRMWEDELCTKSA